MTTGTFLPKGRLTYFCQNGTAYQAFYDNIKKCTKILAYSPFDRGLYINFAEFEVPQKITTENELKEIAEAKEETFASQSSFNEAYSISHITETLTEKEDKKNPGDPDFYMLRCCSNCPGGIDRPNCFFCPNFDIAIQKLGRMEDLLSSGDLSDGYHTFNELYYQRCVLFATIVNSYSPRAWKSFRDENGNLCFGGGWFIVGIDTPLGTYTYHYQNRYYGMFNCKELECAKHFDGHTDKDVPRLLSLNLSDELLAFIRFIREEELVVINEDTGEKRLDNFIPQWQISNDLVDKYIQLRNCGRYIDSKIND